jgi:hypothetical protein
MCQMAKSDAVRFPRSSSPYHEADTRSSPLALVANPKKAKRIKKPKCMAIYNSLSARLTPAARFCSAKSPGCSLCAVPHRESAPWPYGHRSLAPSVAQRRGSRFSESSKIRKQNALAAPQSGLVGCSHISHTLAASNPVMEFVMIRLILFAWFALAAILLVATDLSEDHHLKQISSTYFAQNDNYQTPHTIRHHS